MHRSNEIVVIRSPAGARPAPCDPGPLTREQTRDLRAILEAVTCPTRLRLLLLLAVHGRCTVGTLCRLSELPQTMVSGHLSKLRDKGLVYKQPDGKYAWYELEDVVRYEQHPTHCALTITARITGVAVTITRPGTGEVAG